MKRYVYDVRMYVTAWVDADTEEQARALLDAAVEDLGPFGQLDERVYVLTPSVDEIDLDDVKEVDA